ncbi:putative WD repeat-containing protein [Drosera capensis]
MNSASSIPSDGACEEEEEDMDIDNARKATEVAHASAAAEMLGMDSADVGDALAELKMDNYDDEDYGIELFSRLLGDSYYASNDMDPNLKDNDDNDSEEEEDMIIKANDLVIVCARNDDDVSHLERDVRKPFHSGYKWSIPADVESLAWDPHTESSFIVSLENGTVQGFDIRAASSNSGSESKPVFTLHAHNEAVCSISYSPAVPNLLATGSMDKMVKLWDLSNNQPSCVASKNPKANI